MFNDVSFSSLPPLGGRDSQGSRVEIDELAFLPEPLGLELQDTAI
jgi:hypothetical protein